MVFTTACVVVSTTRRGCSAWSNRRLRPSRDQASTGALPARVLPGSRHSTSGLSVVLKTVRLSSDPSTASCVPSGLGAAAAYARAVGLPTAWATATSIGQTPSVTVETPPHVCLAPVVKLRGNPAVVYAVTPEPGPTASDVPLAGARPTSATAGKVGRSYTRTGSSQEATTAPPAAASV